MQNIELFCYRRILDERILFSVMEENKENLRIGQEVRMRRKRGKMRGTKRNGRKNREMHDQTMIE